MHFFKVPRTNVPAISIYSTEHRNSCSIKFSCPFWICNTVNITGLRYDTILKFAANMTRRRIDIFCRNNQLKSQDIKFSMINQRFIYTVHFFIHSGYVRITTVVLFSRIGNEGSVGNLVMIFLSDHNGFINVSSQCCALVCEIVTFSIIWSYCLIHIFSAVIDLLQRTLQNVVQSFLFSNTYKYWILCVPYLNVIDVLEVLN